MVITTNRLQISIFILRAMIQLHLCWKTMLVVCCGIRAARDLEDNDLYTIDEDWIELGRACEF